MLFEQNIYFEAPQLLWATILPLLIFIYALKAKISNYKRRIISLQTAIAALLIFALSDPMLAKSAGSGQAALLLDISDSMDKEVARSLYKQAAELVSNLNQPSAGTENSEKPAILAFASDPDVFSLSSMPPDYQTLLNLKDRLSGSATNIEKAVLEASKYSKNVVLVSDGQQNRGNIFEKLSQISARVFPLIPDRADNRIDNGIQILSLENPLIVDSKKSAEIKVGLLNTSSQPQSGRLNIFDADKQILSRQIKLEANQGNVFSALSDSEQTGSRKIRAIFETDGGQFKTSEKSAFLSSNPGEKVLLLSGSSEDAGLLQQAFENKAFDLQSVLPGQDSVSLKEVSVVILNNISNSQLPKGLATELPQYVRNGGGLIMTGGNRSFGLGGYIGSLIADLLPVELLPAKSQEKRLTIAVSLIIDKSRSMADNQKLDFAKEAARDVVKTLKDEDFIGVIGFDASPFEVVRMAQLSQNRSQVLERIGRLFPAQKTNLFPALDEGRRRLMAAQTGRKHMIVLTDGKLPDADNSYMELVKEMRLNGITLSTVLIGSEYDFGFLKEMSEKGGGAYYQTDDPSSLPRIFLQDVKVKSGDQALKEQSNYPVDLGPSGLVSTRIQDYPDLLGFVETKPKSQASHELSINELGKDFPLLSSWQVGKGRVLAFTSDANGRWSKKWSSWPGFVKFWTEILDSTRLNNMESPVKYDLRTAIEGEQILLDLTLFEELNGKLETHISNSAGQSQNLNFSEVAKGHYKARFKIEQKDSVYSFSGTAAGRKLTAVSFEVKAEDLSEKQGSGFNRAVLEELAAQSGGKINPVAADLLSSAKEHTSVRSLRYELLIASLLLYFLGILQREIVERPFWRVYNRKGS